EADPARALDMSVFAGWGLGENAAFVALFTRLRTAIRDQGVRATLHGIVAGEG
ncbi:hypothetical protein HUK84_20440, partial [Nguyenibacter vanlangensis]|nr:hypothetical protein [Nguyenibacter vanlangensis]